MHSKEQNIYPEKTIAQVLYESYTKHGDKEALIFQDGTYTYSELWQEVCTLAKGFDSIGIRKGDRVATIFGIRPEWVVIKFALSLIGAVMVPINVTYTAREIEFLLQQSDSNIIITEKEIRGKDIVEVLGQMVETPVENLESALKEKFPELKKVIFYPESDSDRETGYSDLLAAGADYTNEEMLARLDEIKPEDICYILYTSGTTAFPKGALRSHRSLTGIAYHLMHGGLRMNEKDKILGYLPFYHIAGSVYCVLSSILLGATIYLADFIPDLVLDIIAKEKITILGGFDTHFNALFNNPSYESSDVSSVRKILLAAGPEWYDKLIEGGLGLDAIAHHYGFTEGTGVIMPFEETDYEKRKHSNGKPFPGVQVKIKNPDTYEELGANEGGEICVKGWNLYDGYYKMEEETKNAVDDEGFFHTGDYGWLDDDGFVYYRGRYKMMIKSGGENVSEKEVEILLESIPAVKTVQVVGVPDDVWGEAVTAIVEVEKDSTLTYEDVRSYCKGKIADFKIPKNVLFIESSSWPVTLTGKFDKNQLKKWAVQQINNNT